MAIEIARIFLTIFYSFSYTSTPVDLPSTESYQEEVIAATVTVVVTEDDRYVVLPNGTIDAPVPFEEVKDLIEAEMAESTKMKLKIKGNRDSSYEAVFRVLALCQENGWDPILAYEHD